MMNNWISRVLSLVLCLCLTVGLVPAQAVNAQTDDPGYLELNDGYLSVRVSRENGGFLVDTVEGDKLTKSDNNKFLLYPDGAYDTSYTSFRITRNGKVKDYIFGRDYSFLGLGGNDLTVTQSGEGTITAVWENDGLKFTQNLSLMATNNAQHGMVYITYSVENLSGEPVDRVQARVMLDTALGYQDYAVYMGAQADGSYTSVRTERTIQGSEYTNYIMAFDDEYAPSVTAYLLNAAVDGTGITPEKVTFAHWNNLASTVFDYEPAADHTQSLNFTTPYNEPYLTADSAVAMYYDMGTAEAGQQSAQSVALYYGVYSNVNAQEGSVALNFAGTTDMVLTEDKQAYRDMNGDTSGNFTLTTRVQNTSAETISSLAVAFYTPEYVTSYDASGNPNTEVTAADPFYVMVRDLKPGEIRDITLDFQAEPTEISDSRRLNVRVFDLSNQTEASQIMLLEENVLGSRECYILCPGKGGEGLSFISINPTIVYTTGTRHLYLAGKNFGMLRDTSQYQVVLRPADGTADLILPAENVLLNPADNTADLVLDQEMAPGTWQVVIDWNDTGKADITSEALRFQVTDDATYHSASYGIVAVWISGNGKSSPWHYNLELFADESAYAEKLGDLPLEDILLVFRGNFTTKYDSVGNLISAEAVALNDGEVISINECLDVSDGNVVITVNRDENGGQTSIDTDIDGIVTTTGANTKVWEGVCAITSLVEGDLTKFPVYNYDGTLSRFVEDQAANTDMLMLLWPGAASTAQTLAGVVMELRYCQFGVMAMEANSEPDRHVISFGAQLSPNFLVPAANIPTSKETSTLDMVQLKLAKTNYTPGQLREVQKTYKSDIENFKKIRTGSLDFRVTDILFGGGFIGFNTTLSVGIPSYAEGLPSIEGTLNLKVINDEWAFGLSGRADMLVFNMEAELGLRSCQGIPVPDKVRFHVGGFTPGVNIDGMGVFWIRGAGAGVDKIYETFFVSSKIPPITLLLSGEYSLFTILSARSDTSISLRGISLALSDISLAEVEILDYLGGSIYWYPRIDASLGIRLELLEIFTGSGSLVMQETETGGLFWEAFATATTVIPRYVPILGGETISRTHFGLDAEHIYGATKFLGFQVGISYYWGGDVDFAVGKYKVPEPTLAGNTLAVPVYTDPDTGRTLYMSTMTNARVLASTGAPIDITETEIYTSLEGLSHQFTLDGAADEDAALYVTFPAENVVVANVLKMLFSVHCGDEKYELVWLDSSKPADDPANADANARFRYDEEAGQVQITVSVTDSRFFDREIRVSTPAISNLTLYGLTRLADLEQIQVSGTTAVITGSKLNELSKLTVYAVNEQGTAWLLSEVDTSAVNDSVETALTFPENLPSGSYRIQAVGMVKDELDRAVANPIVETDFTYTNPNQPQAPAAASATLGGDYTLDVTVSGAGTFDGYVATVYEQTANGPEATVFQQQTFPAEQTVLTMGGQYTMPVADTLDENGNILTYKEQLVGLEAGKQYVVGISAYREMSNGTMLFSDEILTEPVTMIAPVKQEITLSVAGGKMLSAGYGDVTMAYAATADVVVEVAGVDTVQNGSYQLGSGEQTAWTGGSITLNDLADGTYTLTVTGENAAGDSFGTVFQFAVDTTAPRLMLSSPQGGGFFTGGALTVSGLSEPGALITVSLDGTNAVTAAGEDGSFRVDVPMDPGMAYQNLVLTARDSLGNASDPVAISMTNALLGDPNAEAIVLVDGVEANSVSATAGEVRLELALKVGDQIVCLNSNSLTAGLVEYQPVIHQGEATVTADGILRVSPDVQGIIRVSLEHYDAFVRLENMDLANAQVELDLPDEGYIYDGTAKEPPVASVVVNGKALTQYTVSYENNVDAGVAAVIIRAAEGSGYVGEIRVSFPIAKAVIETVIPAVTAPVIDAEPQKMLELPNIEQAQIIWTANGEPVSGAFLPDTAYTATVTLTPDRNHQFSDTLTADGWSVTVNADGTATLTKTFPMTDPAIDFVDVHPTDWFYDAVRATVKARIIKGVDETHFNPGGTLTRAEWLTMLYRTAGSPAVTAASSFLDVPADAFYADAFAWAEALGIVKGVGGGLGAPDLTIPREQMVTMLYRYHGAQAVSYDMSSFTDMDDVSDYAVDAFVWAISNGYIIGMTPTTLLPGGIANRAQAVTVLARYLDLT